MRIWKPYLFVVIFLILGLYFSDRGVKAEVKMSSKKVITKIYFIPFEIETYAPVTMTDMEDKSLHRIWFTNEHVFPIKIQRLIEENKTNNKIDNKVIRLKIEFFKDGHIYYIDQNGVVLKDDKTNFQISKKTMDAIQNDILYFIGIVDINAAKNILNKK